MSNEINYKVIIAYDGNYFHGWAKQPGLITVQGELEKKLSKLFDQKIIIHSSGRTDRYVHAVAQVFSFKANTSIPVQAIIQVLNKPRFHYFVKEVFIVDKNFHARFSAKNKTYRYKIKTKWNEEEFIFLQNYFLLYEYNLNYELLNQGIEILKGTHDFASFSAKEDYFDSIRTINYINLIKNDNSLILEFNGNGFLRYMVRNLVGSLLALNEEKITLLEFKEYLLFPSKGKVHYKAKGNSLYLYEVFY